MPDQNREPETAEEGAEESGVLSVRDRRRREREIWRAAFVISVGLHVLLFLLWPSGGGPESPFAAAGPQAQDDQAAEGFMQAVALSSAPPDPIQPPPIPTIEADLPEPVDFEPDATPEVDLTEPDVPEPGQGNTDGTDADDTEPAGIPGASGAGDAGTDEEGLFRVVPPSPRGVIFPPTNRNLDGDLEVWVFVDEAGRVVPDSTRLEPPTSDRSYNEQVKEEAAGWMFRPARRGEEVVASWWHYTISR